MKREEKHQETFPQARETSLSGEVVSIRLKPGIGSLKYVSGELSFSLGSGETRAISRAEWESLKEIQIYCEAAPAAEAGPKGEA